MASKHPRSRKSHLVALLLSLVFLGYFYVRRPGTGIIVAFLAAFGYLTIAVSTTVFVLPVGLILWALGILHTQFLVHRWNRSLSD
jgi:hypothetical protein